MHFPIERSPTPPPVSAAPARSASPAALATEPSGDFVRCASRASDAFTECSFDVSSEDMAGAPPVELERRAAASPPRALGTCLPWINVAADRGVGVLTRLALARSSPGPRAVRPAPSPRESLEAPTRPVKLPTFAPRATRSAPEQTPSVPTPYSIDPTPRATRPTPDETPSAPTPYALDPTPRATRPTPHTSRNPFGEVVRRDAGHLDGSSVPGPDAGRIARRRPRS